MPGMNNENATPTEDVSLDDMDNPNRSKSPRELAMERMEAQHFARIQAENGEIPTPVTPTQDEDDPADDQIAHQLTSDDVIADPAGKRIRVKVDGVEQDVALDEVIRSYQKGSAADRRLEEATRLLKEAREAATPQPTKTDPTPEPAATPPAAGPDALVDPLKQALGHLYSGDEETAAKALADVIARSAAPAATPHAPLDTAQIVAQVQDQMAFQGALDKVNTDYPDLVGNSDLEQLTFIKAQGHLAGGKSRADALLAAAEDVYTLIGKKPGRPEPKTPRQEKIDRKAALDPVPAASMAAPGNVPEDEPSPSSVIAEMAKKRLGQTLPGR